MKLFATLMVMFFAAALWSVVGLFAPRAVVWWAVPERRTRIGAFFFALSVAVLCFQLAIPFIPEVPGQTVVLSLLWLPLLVLQTRRLLGLTSPTKMTGKAQGPGPVVAGGHTSPPTSASRSVRDAETEEEGDSEQVGTWPQVTVSVRELTDEEERGERDEELRQQWREELRALLGAKQAKAQEACYRELFGGDIQCLFNFRMFMARVGDGPTAFVVPIYDHYRHRFEALARTGAVLHGEDVRVLDRLGCLDMDQLRKLADAVGAKRARGKRELRERIEASGEEAVSKAWPDLGIEESDIYLIDMERVRAMCG